MNASHIKSKSKNWGFVLDIIATLLILFAVYWIATHIWLNQGLSWHVIAAKRMLAGGTYLTNLFDDSTPSTFGIFIPIIWAHKWFGGSWPALIVAYVLVLHAFTFALCYGVLSKHYASSYHWRRLYYASILLVTLPAIFILGQRENLVIAMLLPYLYLIVSDPKINGLKNNSAGKISSGIIGFLAAVAVTQLLPYLLVIAIMDFIVFRLKKSQHTRVARYSFYFSFFLLMIISYIKYPEYFTRVIPLISCFESGYNSGIITTAVNMVSSLYVFIMLVIFSIYLFLSKKRTLPILCFYILTWSFWLIHVAERKTWYYHVYPSFSLLLITISMSLFLKKKYKYKIIDKILLLIQYICTAFIIIIIVQQTLDVNSDFNNKKSPLNQLIQFNKHIVKSDSALTFFTRLSPTFPMAHYTNTHIVNPWPNTWRIPKWVNTKNPSGSICRFNEGKTLFYQQVYRVLTRDKPGYIMLDSRKNIPYINAEYFSFIDLLKKDARIAEILKRYHYVDRFAGVTVLKREN